MRFGSLFTGVGGLDLGLERAGMTCAWQVEIDDYCRQVLAKHWPDVPRFSDVKDVDAHQLEPVDLICGGFPCQPVSVAGHGQAQADARWLWPEFARIVRGVRPRYVLVENVPGLLAAQQGRAAQEVFGDLAKLGFDAEWASIPAAAVGAPHLRYRVFVVAYAGSEQLRQQSGWSSGPCRASSALVGVDGEARTMADPDAIRWDGRARFLRSGGWRESPHCGGWITEPDVGRVAHGIPKRVDRLRALGNAVVPQVAEWVGRRILEAETL